MMPFRFTSAGCGQRATGAAERDTVMKGYLGML